MCGAITGSEDAGLDVVKGIVELRFGESVPMTEDILFLDF